jgi:hypothetical protein
MSTRQIAKKSIFLTVFLKEADGEEQAVYLSGINQTQSLF